MSVAVQSTSKTPAWLLYAIAGVFGLVFAYSVWNAIGNLLAAIAAGADVGLSLLPLGWVVWIIAALMPIVIFTVAFLIGRRLAPLQLLLVMLTGVALEAVFWVNVVAYTLSNTAPFYG